MLTSAAATPPVRRRSASRSSTRYRRAKSRASSTATISVRSATTATVESSAPRQPSARTTRNTSRSCETGHGGRIGSFGYPTAAMGPPDPSDSSLDHPVPVLSSATLRPQENQPRTRLVLEKGPEGARLACGKPWRSLHPGTEVFRFPFILEVGRPTSADLRRSGPRRGCFLLPCRLSGYRAVSISLPDFKPPLPEEENTLPKGPGGSPSKPSKSPIKYVPVPKPKKK